MGDPVTARCVSGDLVDASPRAKAGRGLSEERNCDSIMSKGIYIGMLREDDPCRQVISLGLSKLESRDMDKFTTTKLILKSR